MKKKEGDRFSIEYCKKVLNRNGNNYTDDQLREIRDFLYFLAEMDYEIFQESNIKSIE